MSKDNKEVNEMQLTDEQLATARKQIRESLREKFDKWMTVYDEDATDDDIKQAKDEFDAEIEIYQNKMYTIMEKDAKAFAELARNWNNKFAHWENGSWKGVAMFNKVMTEQIEKYEKDPSLPFEVDYSTLMYMYQIMGQPSGYGLESAMAMAEFENYNLETGEKIDEENYITYSHLLQNIVNEVRMIAAVDKKLKLMRERINIETAGIKFDWKITEIEEFVQLHEAWLGENIPNDDKELQKMM